jgi:mRNA-degrading endonuclease RelE of RelBE toxin-antitoxin system
VAGAQGDYRMIYEIHDSQLVVLVLQLEHRRDVCKLR